MYKLRSNTSSYAWSKIDAYFINVFKIFPRFIAFSYFQLTNSVIKGGRIVATWQPWAIYKYIVMYFIILT